MKNHWYCHVEGQDYGPFTWEQLRAMAAEGRIVTESLVRRDVDQQWFQAAQVPGLLSKSVPVSAAKNGSRAAPTVSRSKTTAAGDSAKGSVAVKSAKPRAVASGAVSPVAPPVISAPSAGVPAPASPPADSGFFPQIAVNQTPLSRGKRSATPAVKPDPSASGIELVPPSKPNNPVIIFGALVGVIAVLLFVGISLIVINNWPKKTPEEQTADALKKDLEQVAADLQNEPPTDLAEAAAALETLAPEMEKALDKAAKSLPVPGASANAASPRSAGDDVQAVLKSQPRWRDITTIQYTSLTNGVKLRVKSAWVASDATGKRVEPVVDASGKSATIADAKYVFIEVEVVNGAAVARNYASWNAASPVAAVLGDQNNEVLAFVPPSDTPELTRHAAVDIPPGQAITDLLVFQSPAGSLEKLKLALAVTAVTGPGKGRGYFALEIPLESLLASAAASSEEPPAVGASAPQTPAPSNPLVAAPGPDFVPPLEIDDDQKAAAGKPVMATAAPPAKKAGSKSSSTKTTTADLSKTFEELAKPAEAPEPKKTEPAKTTPPTPEAASKDGAPPAGNAPPAGKSPQKEPEKKSDAT